MGKIPVVLLIGLVCTSSQALAGKLYGSLVLNGKPLATNTNLTVTCGNATYTGTVKANGRYTVVAAKEGACRLQVQGYPGASAKVVSYAEATRYNFAISGSGGNYKMQRR